MLRCLVVGVPHPPPPRVYIRTHKNVRTLNILQSMSEFGGLRKHENTARRKNKTKKLGSAVLWLLVFPGESSPNFPCIALGTRTLI